MPILDCSVNTCVHYADNCCCRREMCIRDRRTTFQNVSLQPFRDVTMQNIGFSGEDFFVVLFGCLVVLTVSILQERGVKIREALSERNWFLRWVAYGLLLLALPLLGETGPIGGFIYAQF